MGPHRIPPNVTRKSKRRQLADPNRRRLGVGARHALESALVAANFLSRLDA